MTGFRKFMIVLKKRIRYMGIVLVEVDKYYPLSKKCSHFGLVMTGDLNASINYKNYIVG